MSSSVLLENATIITLVGDKPTILKNHSLLITGNRISHIATEITDVPESAERLDCSGKIVSPGFIDTHHHLWQSQLKGRHANETLFEYVLSGNLHSSLYSPDDIYWGQLSGCLEAIDSGTTTVVDHSHCNYSPDHAVDATVASGIRSVYGYTPTLRVKSWKPFAMAEDVLAPWVMDTFEKLAKSGSFGNGRVLLGFAFDALFLPKEIIANIFQKARSLGAQLITLHQVMNNLMDFPTIQILDNYGLLGPDILISHACGSSAEEAQALKAANGHVSSTPDTEMQMNLGHPVCFRPDLQDRASLGIDCHSNNSASIVTQMRLAIQHERVNWNQKFIDNSKFPNHLEHKVEKAFNLGTIDGARAAGLEKSTGSLEVGKLADIVIFNGDTPGMLAAAQRDPVAAVVFHSSIRDIDMVIIDGEIRKQNGRLLPSSNPDGQRIEWGEVTKRVLESQRDLESKAEKIDFETARAGVLQSWQVREGIMTDV